MFDPGWIRALELPMRVTAGVCAASWAVFALDAFQVISLEEFGRLARPIVILLGVVTACLFFISLVADVVEEWKHRRRRTNVRSRQMKRLEEQKAKEDEKIAAVLARLNHLSEEEVFHAAQALRGNSPSIQTYVHSPAAAQLIQKGLLSSPGGQFNRDHYPFIFHDFVWEELLRRKDEFLAEDAKREDRSRRKGQR